MCEMGVSRGGASRLRCAIAGACAAWLCTRCTKREREKENGSDVT